MGLQYTHLYLLTIIIIHQDGLVSYEIDDDEGVAVAISPTTAMTQLLLAVKSTAEDAIHAKATHACITVPDQYPQHARLALRYGRG